MKKLFKEFIIKMVLCVVTFVIAESLAEGLLFKYDIIVLDTYLSSWLAVFAIGYGTITIGEYIVRIILTFIDQTCNLIESIETKIKRKIFLIKHKKDKVKFIEQ